MRSGADARLKWAFLHNDDRVREVCIVGRGIARSDAGMAHRIGEGSSAFECDFFIAEKWLTPQPLHNCPIGVTTVNIERVTTSWRGEYVDNVV